MIKIFLENMQAKGSYSLSKEKGIGQGDVFIGVQN